MGKENKGSRDVLGLAPYGEAVKIATKAAVDGASAFLGRICLPAAEEFGLLLRDKVRAWRANNLVRILQKAEAKLNEMGGVEGKQAHPRLVADIVERGSWCDADDVQELWAGLLASSCSPDGSDESNLLFINLLSQLTHAEARILSHAGTHCRKSATPGGIATSAGWPTYNVPLLQEVSGLEDAYLLDIQIDHLRSLGLTMGGFDASLSDLRAGIRPTELGLCLYVRCQGSTASPVEHFNLSVPDPQPKNEQ